MFHLAVILLSVIPLAPRTDVRTVTLICEQGWQAGAVGQVGGVSFSVQCQNGRGKARLVGVSGTSYAARMGDCVLDERALHLGDERDRAPARGALRAADERTPAAEVDVAALGATNRSPLGGGRDHEGYSGGAIVRQRAE